MKRLLLFLLLFVAFLAPSKAGSVSLTTLQATIAPYELPAGGSNAVITIYKSTSLGTVWTPFKPTAVFPASRTNTFVQVVSPNTFQFYSTATVQPYGESLPSNTVTNTVGITSLAPKMLIRRTVTQTTQPYATTTRKYRAPTAVRVGKR